MNTESGVGALELAELIRSGEISARELVEDFLSRIRDLNPSLMALVRLDDDRALETAARADAALARHESWGPLHGVPFTVKDAFETAGLVTACGTFGLQEHQPETDATVVARIKDAGAILLGKTNVPPLTADYQTANRVFGRTVNPWNRERSPGGSSGGGAAAVASGMSPLEIASDVGGSIRIPAHYCGVFGFKPTNRRLPMTGHIPPFPGKRRGLRHLAAVGFIARTAADLRLALELTHGSDGKDFSVPPVPMERKKSRNPNDLRIAWTPTFTGLPISKEVREVLGNTATTLMEAGVTVVEVEPVGFDLLEAANLFGAIFGAEIYAGQKRDLQEMEQLREIRASGSPEPYTLGYAQGFDSSFEDYCHFLHRREDWIAKVQSLLTEYDAWLCPTAPTVAIPHMTRGQPLDIDGRPWPYMSQGYYCLPFNLSDHPVVVIPVGTGTSKLPVGIQLVGRLWADSGLLDVAESLEEILQQASQGRMVDGRKAS